MKYVWGAAFICALLSLLTGAAVILLLALSGESYTAYSFQCCDRFSSHGLHVDHAAQVPKGGLAVPEDKQTQCWNVVYVNESYFYDDEPTARHLPNREGG